MAYRFEERLGVAGTFSFSLYDGGDEDDWWEVAGVAVGPAYSLPLGSRTALDLKGLVGFYAFTPVVDSYTSPDDVGSGLGLEGRAVLRHELARRVAVFTDGGFVVASGSFDNRNDLFHGSLISGLGVAFRPF